MQRMNRTRIGASGGRRLLLSGLVGLGFGVTLLTSAIASADEACGDKTCPQGYTCVTSELTCRDPVCAPGDECSSTCTPVVEYWCEPATCATDADCGTDMLCTESQVIECTETPTVTCTRDGVCTDAGQPLGADGVDPCTTSTIRQCVPRWQLPCQADADCGAGFTCVEGQTCWCSGSVSMEDGGAVVSEETCGCEPSGVKACQPITTACTTDADCLTGWTCRDNPSSACWVSADGDAGCTPADPPRLCVAPYSDLGGGTSGSTVGGGEEGRDPGTSNGGAGQTVDAGTLPPPSVPGDGATSPPCGHDGSRNRAPWEPWGTPDDQNSRWPGRGCSVGAVPTSTGGGLPWAWIGMGAMLATLRRRR